MASGMHAGDTAVGSAGLMPKTAQEMAKRRQLAKRDDISDKYVLESPSDVVQQMLTNNDDLRNRYVQDMAEKVMTRAKGDPSLAATAWLYGHNLPYGRLEEKLANDPEYSSRIDRAINELHLQSNKPTFDIPALEETAKSVPLVKPYSKLHNKLFKK